MKTHMAVSNPEILLNPSYQNYVSSKTLGENINQPTFYNETEPLKRGDRFTYYDSDVVNSRLYPTIIKTHNRVYNPYDYPPQTSQILKGIERKAPADKDKLLPVFQ